MTVVSTVQRNDYTGSGTTGPFAYTFRIFAATDLRVVTASSVTGVETVLAYPADYSVTGVGSGTGGTVTLTTALASGHALSLQRDLSLLQSRSIRNQGPFFPGTVEDALDYLTMIDQSQQDAIDRSFKVPDTIAPSTVSTEIASFLPTYYLRVKADGSGIEGVTNVVAAQNFIQSGTGAVVRTANAKMADLVNLADFGATGNGSTNDAAAITAAIAAVPSGGTIMGTPGATYAIATGLTITKPLTFWLYGATVKATAAMTDMMKSTDQGGIMVLGGTFDQNSLAVNAISFYSTNASPANYLVAYNTFRNAPLDATLNFGSVRTLATGGAGSTHRCQHVNVLWNTFESSGRSIALMFTYADHCASVGNAVGAISQEGIMHVGCTQIVCIGNKLTGTTLNGIEVGAQSSYFVVANNELTGCAGTQDAGISVESCCAHGSVTHNVLADCPVEGINVSFNSAGSSPNDTVRNVTVQGNTLRARVGVTTKIGINAYGSSAALANGIKILDNTIDGFNRGVILSYAQWSAVRGNSVTNLTGSNSFAVQAVFCLYTPIEDNQCDTTTGDHAYQAITQVGVPANKPDFISFRRNTVITSGAAGVKACCYFEGTGSVVVDGNITGGSTSYIKCSGAATLMLGPNMGGVSVAAVEGSPTFYQGEVGAIRSRGKTIAVLGLGVGNSAAAATLGTVIKKVQMFDASGVSIGYAPIYDAIT